MLHSRTQPENYSLLRVLRYNHLTHVGVAIVKVAHLQFSLTLSQLVVLKATLELPPARLVAKYSEAKS